MIATINSPEIIEGIQSSLPITYEPRKAQKYKLDEYAEDLIIDSQVRQIGTNKIGFYTNVSSSLYALLSEFDEASQEHATILNRLKYGRVLQGLAIDSAKGLETDPFLEYWVKREKITPDMSEAEIKQALFNNSIMADRRPYFMRWLYPHYNSRFKKELNYFNSKTTKWGLKFEALLEAVKNNLEVDEEQLKLVEKYKHNSFFIDNSSTMCRISHHIERKLQEQTTIIREASSKFNYEVLLSKNFKKPSKVELEKLKLLFKEYKSLRKSLRENTFEALGYGEHKSTEQIALIIKNKALKTISSNAGQLADWTVYFCYTVGGNNSKSFLWTIFGRDVLDNIVQSKNQKYVRVPKPNPKGNIQYLWERYGTYLINVENP